MAIALNSSSQGGTSGSTSFSVAHTVNAGTNRLMLVFVECPNSSDFLAAATVSYGGVSLGSAVVTAFDSTNPYVYVYRMINPPVGTANVVVTPSANAYMSVKVVTLDGVDQTSPISATNKTRTGFTSGTSFALPIATNSGGVAVGCFVCRNTTSTLAVLDGATEIGTITSNTASRMIASFKENATQLNYSFTGSQPGTAASAVALNAATGGGTAPTGTVTIGSITPNSTGASVPFTYSAADQTGFEYRLNGGAAVTGTASPQVLTGLTSSTAYTIEIRAINASGQGAWSTAANFTTSAPAAQVPQGTVTIGTVTTTQTTASVPYTYSLSDQTGFEYRLNGGSAVTATASPQSLTGLTANTAYTIEIRAINATGAGTWSAVKNFTTAAVATGTLTITDLANNIDTPWASAAVDAATVMPLSLGSVVVSKTGLSTTAGADLVITDASIVTGAEYIIILKIGTAYGWYRAVAT